MSDKKNNEVDRVANLAVELSSRFFETGSYKLAEARAELGQTNIVPAVDISQEDDVVLEQVSCSGVPITTVGYSIEEQVHKIFVYTTKKEARKVKKLPKELQGCEIVYKMLKPVTIQPDQTTKLTTHQGHTFVKGHRIACGSSCAPAQKQYSGTIGAILRERNTNQLFLLSNNHVFSDCNHVPSGMPILSPSNQDTGPYGASIRTVARHHKFIELRSGDFNIVSPCKFDLAIAKVEDESAISSWQGDENKGYDTPQNIVEPDFGMKVKKFGRTSGLTVGKLESFLNTPTGIMYKGQFFKAKVWVKDVWTIVVESPNEHFALPGDSGSLVVTEDGQSAVGVIFAAKDEYAFMMPLEPALESLGEFDLVSEHGIE